MSLGYKLTDQFTRPLVVAGLSYLASKTMNSEHFDSVQLPFTSMQVSLHTYLAMVGGGASVLSETLSNWVYPYLPQSEAFATYEAALTRPALNGLMNIGFTRVLYPSVYTSVGPTNLFAVGGLSELGGDYVYTNFVKPML